MKKMKRILAMLLCVLMACSGPLGVFAEEVQPECNCETTTEEHAETCPKYVKPEAKKVCEICQKEVCVCDENKESTVQTLEEELPECNCQTTDGIHAETCPKYVKSEPVKVCETCQQEVCICSQPKVEDENDTYEPEDSTQSGESTKVEMEDGTVVIVEDIPEDAKLSVTNPENKKTQIVRLIADNLFSFDSSVVQDSVLSLTYDIKIMQGEDEWQPTNGESVCVTLEVPEFHLDYKTYLQGIHILDTVDAISLAVSNGDAMTLTEPDLSKTFPEETSAAREAGLPEDTIVYTIMLPETGDMYIDDGDIVIETTSFSTMNIIAFNVNNQARTGEIEDNGLKLNKTATVDYNTGEGYVELSSYVKGSVTNTPTDVVLVIDHSGSMWTAVDPENRLKFDELNKEKGAHEGYYVAFKNDADPGSQKSTACLVRYEDQKWQRSKYIESTVYEGNKFVGFINTIYGDDRQWEDISEGEKESHIFAVSISGALYDALNIFMKEMENAVNCRVAICTFAGKVSNDDKDTNGKTALEKVSNDDLNPAKDFSGSGIFVDGVLTWDGTSQTLPRSSNVEEANSYRDAFEDPSVEEGKEILFDTIEQINTDYGNTPTALGLLYARRLFNHGGRSGSNKVAVVFTDGIPSTSLKTRPSDSCDHDNKFYYGNNEKYKSAEEALDAAKQYQNECEFCEPMKFEVTQNDDTKRYYRCVSTYVDQANQLKTANKATVYSIGPTSGKAGIDVLSKIASDDNHYYNASGSDIAKVFRDIAGFIVSSSQELNKESQTVDIISESFMIPENAKAENIEVYTASYSGTENGIDKFGKLEKFEGAEVTLSEDKKTVRVWNFDYENQAVAMEGTKAVGQKLVVRIPIKTEPDFLGGNGVPTNASAGIYNGTVCVKEFQKPEVDVQVKSINPNVSDSDIYLSQAVALPHIANAGKFTLNSTEYTINGINNKYVDIIYTITNQNNQKSFTYTIPAGTEYSKLPAFGDEAYAVLTDDSTTYRITCEIKAGGNNCTSKEADSQIRVYKPVITFHDSVIDLGHTADYQKENYTSIQWMNGNNLANIETMGAAPDLQYQYAVEAGAFTKDQPVNILKAVSPASAKLKLRVPADMDLVRFATFYREACSFRACEHTSEQKVTNNEANFVVHLDKFDLLIEKEGNSEELALDENQTFIFRITGPNGFSMDVVIEGKGEAKVVSLPIGTTSYQVTELKKWSWRYDVDGDETVKVDLEKHDENGTVTVTFENKRENSYWMDGNSHAQNIFKDSSIIPSGNIYQEGGN